MNRSCGVPECGTAPYRLRQVLREACLLGLSSTDIAIAFAQVLACASAALI
jgi:hypothetical protein